MKRFLAWLGLRTYPKTLYLRPGVSYRHADGTPWVVHSKAEEADFYDHAYVLVHGPAPVGPWQWKWLLPLQSFGVSVAFLPGVAGAATSPRWAVASLSLPYLTWPVMLFAAFCCWRLGADAGMKWAITCAAFCWGRRVDDIRPAVKAFAVGIAVSGVLAALQLLDPVLVAFIPQTHAPGGLFLNKNVMGEAAAVALVVCWRLELNTYAVLCLPALLLSQCRAALLAWCVAMTAVFHRMAVFLILAGFVFWWHGGLASLAERVSLWHAALPYLTLLGNGAPYEPLHNEFLQLPFEIGVAAVAPCAVLYCVAVRDLPIALVVAVIASFGFALHMPATAWLIAAVCGHVVERVPVDGRNSAVVARHRRGDAHLSVHRA